ncbi:MAG: hypothetical protein J2P28_19605 [Actinobacteria bacterium]|nr:hypothetical protein [Actinomycetota bacterium]
MKPPVESDGEEDAKAPEDRSSDEVHKRPDRAEAEHWIGVYEDLLQQADELLSGPLAPGQAEFIRQGRTHCEERLSFWRRAASRAD